MGYSRFDSLTWSEVKVSPETSPNFTLLRLTRKKISLAQIIDFVFFLPNYLWMKGWNFQCRKAVEVMFFFGGGSWLNMIGAGHASHENRTRTLNSPWRTIGRSGVIAGGWSLNDKDAVFRYNFLDVLTVTCPSISWFVSNSTILLQDCDHEVGQWIRIVRDDYHLMNHPFKQQNLPWSWATVQQSTYFFGLLKWAVCGLRMVISWIRMLRFSEPVRRTATMRISGEWMQFLGMFFSSFWFFPTTKSEMDFDEGPLLVLTPTPCFFLRIIIKKFKGGHNF